MSDKYLSLHLLNFGYRVLCARLIPDVQVGGPS